MRKNSVEQSAKNALKTVAKRNGISEKTVRHEIEAAIAAARENSNPNIQAFWRSVPCKNGVPIPEAVVSYITQITCEIRH